MTWNWSYYYQFRLGKLFLECVLPTTLALGQQVDEQFAYVERITQHTESCTNDGLMDGVLE